MSPSWQVRIAAYLGVLGCAITAGAVWIDRPASLPGETFASYPEPVEEVAAPAPESSPSLPGELVVDLAKKAVGDHLLITGRAVRPADSKVADANQESAPQARPHYPHPATIFETIMGVLILLVLASLAWLPRLKRRPRPDPRYRRRSQRRRRVVRATHRAAQPADSPPVRRRRRRVPARP